MTAYQEKMMQMKIPGLCGGEGEAAFTVLFPRGTLPHNVVKVTLAPGASCGEHEHTEDNERFYVLEGELTMIEDGSEYVMHPGDCEYCPIGHSHGAVNRSDAPASYLAITLI